MKRINYGFEVLVHGNPVREYPHGDLTYIEGRKGSKFSLRVINDSFESILAVITIDGRSIMDGKAGSYESSGYVIRPRQSGVIPGWRLDNDGVADFFFTPKGEGYAESMGHPENVGLIGCAIFREKARPVFAFPSFEPGVRGWDPAKYGDPLGLRSSEAISKGISTGFGDRSEHRVETVGFERASATPAAILILNYREREELIRLGVNLRPRQEVAQAFPGQSTGCTPPPGWKEKY